MKFRAWVVSIRIKTLMASIGPVILGLFFSYFYIGQINYIVATATALATLFMQIGSNQVNDYYDFIRGVDDENRLGPERATASGKLSEREIKNFYYLSFAVAFLLGIYLMSVGGIPIILIGLFSLATAYLYTAGPFPLSYFALGELLAFLFFGPIAVWGTFYLQTKSFVSTPLLIGIVPGAIAAMIMSINNLRDTKTDKEKGKTTLATLMGERAFKLIPISLFILSLLIPLVFALCFGKWSVLITLLSPLPFIQKWSWQLALPPGPHLNKVLASVGQYMFLSSLLLGIGLVL